MLAKLFGQVLSVVALKHAGGNNTERVFLGHFQRLLKVPCCHLLGPVDDREHVPQRASHLLAIRLDVRCRQGQEELYVADQVGQAKLHQHVAVPHVSSRSLARRWNSRPAPPSALSNPATCRCERACTSGRGTTRSRTSGRFPCVWSCRCSPRPRPALTRTTPHTSEPTLRSLCQ